MWEFVFIMHPRVAKDHNNYAAAHSQFFYGVCIRYVKIKDTHLTIRGIPNLLKIYFTCMHGNNIMTYVAI